MTFLDRYRTKPISFRCLIQQRSGFLTHSSSHRELGHWLRDPSASWRPICDVTLNSRKAVWGNCGGAKVELTSTVSAVRE